MHVAFMITIVIIGAIGFLALEFIHMAMSDMLKKILSDIARLKEEEGYARGWDKGIHDGTYIIGRQEGMFEAFSDLVSDGILSKSDAHSMAENFKFRMDM